MKYSHQRAPAREQGDITAGSGSISQPASPAAAIFNDHDGLELSATTSAAAALSPLASRWRITSSTMPWLVASVLLQP